MPSFPLFVSSSAVERLTFARDAVRACAPGTRVLILGASRGAADDLARAVAAGVPATFGIRRLSVIQLAARAAIVSLASEGCTPSSWLAAEAVATRAVFDAAREGALGYLEPVAATPGFPRALARTLQELRLARARGEHLAPLLLAGPDLAVLLDRFEACFHGASAVDRADLLQRAAAMIRARAAGADGGPADEAVVLLDVPIGDPAERDLIAAVVEGASRVAATSPHGDAETILHLIGMGGSIASGRMASGPLPAHDAMPSSALAQLRQFLFISDAHPPERSLDGSMEFFSAPGEGRECVEIARRILREAREGVRFDEMAILVRSPESYFGLLEHALRRADVPAWFDRGTRRPHPAGRAFLALLACAAERLSASRFAEYLSLGQVPAIEAAFPDDDPAAAAVADMPLSAPWRWEKLLVEAAVIGQDARRWRRRLDGKAAELRLQMTEAARQDGDDSAKAHALAQTLAQLEHLRAFSLPIVEELAGWPRRATWGAWLARFSALAPTALRAPAHVLGVLADLQPMASVGPIDLDEARRVLAERLLLLESEPPSRRFGCVFVGTPAQARGRSFRVVFVPGLAERMFPRKPREDALLLDALRVQVAGAALATQKNRLAAERLLLHIAVGAASDRLYVSYPRIDLAEGRARVPSFYALDLIRAAIGRIPEHEWLEDLARDTGSATLAWPAPPRPDAAIDDQEHDLAVLRRLLDEPDRDAVKGHAHYLLKLNECLRRSVVDRWARGEPRWSVHDGLTRLSPDTAPVLARQRLTARPYSLSALQRFSACPYQFVLAAIYRLQPLERPEALQRMDPLTRGSIFHEVQARFFRALEARHALPVTGANVSEARAVLDGVVDAVAARAHDELAPAVERVWADEILSIRRDLHAWLPYLAADGAEWRPRHFELAFGSVPGERDASSIRDDVTLAGGFRLRGAIDLIEEHHTTGVLRVTDHKTGRRPERIEKVITGGGSVLQPVLYAMAVEAGLGRPVSHGRLFYCTSAGAYYAHVIPLSPAARGAGLEALQIIDRAVERGFLAAAPAADACGRCDFRPVCGPGMARRVSRKPQDPLADLHALRSRP